MLRDNVGSHTSPLIKTLLDTWDLDENTFMLRDNVYKFDIIRVRKFLGLGSENGTKINLNEELIIDECEFLNAKDIYDYKKSVLSKMKEGVCGEFGYGE